MRKRELAAAVAEAVGLPQRQAAAAVEVLLARLAGELLDAGRVELRGFGVFRVVRHGERRTYIPKTGQIVTVPARKAVRFQAAGSLLESLNGGGS